MRLGRGVPATRRVQVDGRSRLSPVSFVDGGRSWVALTLLGEGFGV